MDSIEKMRKATPCKFEDGISFNDFHEIARSAAKKINRVKCIKVEGPMVYVTVESQTGYSEWDFSVNFNDWGHITGVFWWNSDNKDSNIPHHFGMHMSGAIHNFLNRKGIHLPDYSDYIDKNDQLNVDAGFSYKNVKQMIINGLFNRRGITMNYDSSKIVGEHVCFVVSWLKARGFNNVKCFRVEDIDRNSNNFNYQVEQVVVNGLSFFDKGDSFTPNDEVIVTYHLKSKIEFPHFMRFYRQNYKTVLKKLDNLGFSNRYSRKIKDLVTGFITPDGAVEKIWVEIDGKEEEIERGESYEFDIPIIVEYHTFK